MSTHVRRRSREARAFTLVELLVVIGIIAVLIGVLLPVLSGVQARGRDLKCQSNLRQIVQAMFGYAAENDGVMPYGFYWDPSAPTDWGPVGGEYRFVSWASLVGKYMNRRATGDNDDASFPPVLKCPEAEMVFPHVVSYAANWIVTVSPFDELRVGSPPRAQLKPPLQTWMLKETALLWDTAIQPGWENNVGFLLGADIDGQRFWSGADAPQFRYYSIKDPFSRIPPGIYGNNKPVSLHVGSYLWKNIDPGSPDTHYPYQGNLRFRHQKESACNVGFADGHVATFTGKFRSDKHPLSHDALRRNFMIKWPPGVPPNPGNPH